MASEEHITKVIKPGAFPSDVPEDVREAMEHFYFHSNASSTHNSHKADEEHFASLFTSDGVYNFFGDAGKGRAGIVEVRHRMFNDIPHRDHWVEKVYTRGGDHLEIMVLGAVEYKHHSGVEHAKEWAGHYTLVRGSDGKLKFKYAGIMGDPSQPEGAYDRGKAKTEKHTHESDGNKSHRH